MRYPGGKGKCFQHLINLMPVHETYIESHLGGGAVMRNKRPAQRSIGIELDREVLALWDDVSVHGMELVNQDAIAFLKIFSFSGGELVYSDPPYLPETRRRSRIYRCEYTADDHVELLETLRSLPCNVMISGYDSPLYRDMLRGWRHVTFQTKSHVGLREESVWLNFPAPEALHDARFVGASFRERQYVQRRQATLRRRMHAMSPIERSDFIHWLNETFLGPRKESLCNARA